MTKRRGTGRRASVWAVAGLTGLASLALDGCRRGLDDEVASAPAPPPAAAIAPVRDSMSLDRKLELLEHEIDAALAGELEDDALARLLRAEAITDRLLERPAPFDWLAARYSTEARLRQLQALADRVVAQARRGVAPERVLPELRALREQVARLRADLAQPGGGEAPPTLDELLASVPPDSAAVEVSEGATGE